MLLLLQHRSWRRIGQSTLQSVWRTWAGMKVSGWSDVSSSVTLHLFPSPSPQSCCCFRQRRIYVRLSLWRSLCYLRGGDEKAWWRGGGRRAGGLLWHVFPQCVCHSAEKASARSRELMLPSGSRCRNCSCGWVRRQQSSASASPATWTNSRGFFRPKQREPREGGASIKGGGPMGEINQPQLQVVQEVPACSCHDPPQEQTAG